MSAAQTHPTTVQYPARSGFGAALALIALVALAIVAFAVGQSGLSVGPRAAAPAHDLADYRLQRVGEINTGAPDVPTSPTVDYWAGVEFGEGDRHEGRCGPGALDGRPRPLGRVEGPGGRG